MRNDLCTVCRSPMGEGGGGSGQSLGGSGSPIGSTPSGGVKLPNAIATPAAAGVSAPTEAKPKIQSFSQALGGKKHADTWKRKTNVNGTGATHVRTFHCKLNSESVDYMDQQINEWLDNHPDYEVKMVTSSVGEWTGKIKEPALIVTVWV
jgi:hypothetical protein